MTIYFLIFYIPTASFGFSKPTLKICIIQPLPEAHSLLNDDPGRYPPTVSKSIQQQQHSRTGRPLGNQPLTSSPRGWSQSDTRSRFKAGPFLCIPVSPWSRLHPCTSDPPPTGRRWGPIGVIIYVLILSVSNHKDLTWMVCKDIPCQQRVCLQAPAVEAAGRAGGVRCGSHSLLVHVRMTGAFPAVLLLNFF